jgi:hypothetical protein
MGLDCSHGAFHGAYSAFNRFRQAVAWAAGGSYPPHYLRGKNGSLKMSGGLPVIDHDKDDNCWYWDDSYSYDDNPGLCLFFCHSDCDGEISPEDCIKVANELESLMPKIKKLGMGGGHIERNGGYEKVLQQFIDGCRLAAKNNEPLEFR